MLDEKVLHTYVTMRVGTEAAFAQHLIGRKAYDDMPSFAKPCADGYLDGQSLFCP